MSTIDAMTDFAKGVVENVRVGLKSVAEKYLPENLAQDLNASIDTAANKLNDVLDKSNEVLKAGVNKTIDGAKAAVNGAINLCSTAMQAPFKVAEAYMATGDFAELGSWALNSALAIAGIPEEEFGQMFAKGEETIDFIIENPGQFASNLIDAGVGGFEQFSNNLGKHFSNSIIEWLTGNVDGVSIPDQWI